MRLVLALILLFSCFDAWSKHPTHISIVNMELDTTRMEIKYSIHLYQDDLINLITRLYHKELFHESKEFDINKNTGKIENYFSHCLEVYIDDIKQEAILDKIESEEIDYWLYYTIPLTKRPDEIRIKNLILIQIYSDQTNLLIFSYNDKEKGLTFGVNNTELVLLPD